MKSLTNLYSILLLTGIAFGCGQAETTRPLPSKGEVIPVKVQILEKGSHSNPISTSGNFTTKNETILSFKVGGIVSRIYVQEGEKVKQGQLLATLNLTEIQSGLNQSKIGLEKAKRDFERVTRLYTDSVATLEQKQNAETALEIAEQQFKTAAFNLEYSQIRANQSGFVLAKFANEGQQVASGAPVLQINGNNANAWVFRTNVNDQNWSYITLGDSASLRTDTEESRGFSGKIVRKSQAADPVTGSFWIEIAPDNPGETKFASGMFGRATVFPSNQIEAWEIPYESLLDAQGDQGYVFVSKDQKTAEKVSVKLGKISPKSVQVTEGLAGYPHLIISGSAYLTDQSQIKIQN
ncbi:efflux RND transporter periplasmic adaptor subunit [Algoriphagus sp. AGSA1]|uniref:efflux RND transporter periplasmic adaptor subunit n=1 Tax=Algoriphagus sp. AGSA1 TaxID=2907213 RepID=UPI001F2EFF23|nr:efflux RND transporter periplasmic adaptor subunit [Algoriphagus sp. AGSA1]MCE7056203.1 efflux RND transporter periplasmic adaptor subunit [Algoriphagus sp. AGSA1]